MLTACRSKKDRKDSQQALSRIIIAREGHGLTLVGAPAAPEFATSINDGRRPPLAARSVIDGGEHGARLGQAGRVRETNHA